MTYVDKPRSQRYTGRGLDWRRGPLTRRQARRIARWRAGLIVESALSAGWSPEDLEGRYGREGLEMIKEQLVDITRMIMDGGDPNGEPTR